LTQNAIRLLFAKDNLSFMRASKSGKPGFLETIGHENKEISYTCVVKSYLSLLNTKSVWYFRWQNPQKCS